MKIFRINHDSIFTSSEKNNLVVLYVCCCYWKNFSWLGMHHRSWLGTSLGHLWLKHTCLQWDRAEFSKKTHIDKTNLGHYFIKTDMHSAKSYIQRFCESCVGGASFKLRKYVTHSVKMRLFCAHGQNWVIDILLKYTFSHL